MHTTNLKLLSGAASGKGALQSTDLGGSRYDGSGYGRYFVCLLWAYETFH